MFYQINRNTCNALFDQCDTTFFYTIRLSEREKTRFHFNEAVDESELRGNKTKFVMTNNFVVLQHFKSQV